MTRTPQQRWEQAQRDYASLDETQRTCKHRWNFNRMSPHGEVYECRCGARFQLREGKELPSESLPPKREDYFK